MEDVLDNLQSTNLKFHYRLEPLGKITVILTVLASLFLLFRIISVFMLMRFHPANAGFSIDYSSLMFWANAVDYSIIAFFVFLVISMIPFFMWLYRAYYNFESIKIRGLATSSGWAVGFWFVPFANLYYIPTILNEISRISNHLFKGNPTNKTVEYIGGTPWGVFWLVCRIAGTAFSYMGLAAINENNVMFKLNKAVTMEIISNAFILLSGVIIIMVVLNVTKKQNQIYSNQ